MAPSEKPLISVLIPAYNARATIGRAIEAAIGQTYEPLQIVVADDGSTDDTFALVRERYPNVVTCSGPNGGASIARNRAAAHSDGEVIVLLDADDEMAPTRVERQWEALQSRPDLGGLCCGVAKIYSGRWVRCDPEYSTGDILVPTFLDIALQRCGHMGASFITRREVFEEFGGFDPTPKEKELYLRLAEAGRPVGRLNVPLYFIHIGPGTYRSSLAAMYDSELRILAQWDPQTRDDSPVSPEEYAEWCLLQHLWFARRCLAAGDRATARRCLEAARSSARKARRHLGFWNAWVTGPLWGAASPVARVLARLRDAAVRCRTRYRQSAVRRRMNELGVEWPGEPPE